MGKKYMDTKAGTLESSILGVWPDAAEMKEQGHEARTKSYREHRAKLEAAREKRRARREALASKFIETIKKKSIETEMAYGSGHDTAKPMADMSNLNASKKKKKK